MQRNTSLLLPLRPLVFRGTQWDFSRALIQGVLNLTPDSFSDGGRYASVDEALAQAERMLEQGADCLDVGGESTRPGAPAVSADEESRRVLPVIAEIARRFSVPISVDTCKADVAKRAVEAGAELVNDVSGGLFDHRMFEAVSISGAAYVCGHVRGESLTEVHAAACGTAAAVSAELSERLAAMPQTLRERVIVDPCLGFGKTLACNIELMHSGGALAEHLDAPVLIGPSRKRYLGEIAGRPVGERDCATVGASLAAIAGGANMVRVHDVGMTADALRVFLAKPQVDARG
ncbi:MAG: dihydropteroate synthase [Myxococcales bacterium]|nr:dihydropteroate synthase [Myxococcales bacterium]